jgi:hypothetical protein
MLTILDTGYARHCQGFSRREFLRVGGLALLGGLTLPGLLRARARAAEAGAPVKDRSVVLLFLRGGPSHIEFFDPKMTAPENIRSITGEVKTALPGITFGGTFPKLARLADRLAVVRSYASGNAGHTYLSVTSGGNPLKAAMGALCARVAGTTRAGTGIPTNALVLPEAVQPGLKLGGNFEAGALPTLTSPGELGPTYGAFDLSGGQLQRNMKLTIPRALRRPAPAFLEDVHQRGLSDKILLVITGEMGRTPRRNRDGGRDHYANLTTLAFAGGGLKMGQVIGQSDATASNPVSERYTPKHLLATVMHTLLDVGQVRLQPGLGKAGQAISDGEPIPGLIS